MNPGIPESARFFILLGGINAALAVTFGAFGAHGLKSRITTDMLEVFNTGVQYHLYHALGLLAIGLLLLHQPSSVWLKRAGWIMLTGIVFFSGSLYLLAVTGIRWLGMVTPIGGTAFIASWILLFTAVLRKQGTGH